jgi:hypothetical protein
MLKQSSLGVGTVKWGDCDGEMEDDLADIFFDEARTIRRYSQKKKIYKWSWLGMTALTQSADRLVKLGGDNRVLNEELEGNDFEGVLVSGFEDDGAGRAGLLDLKPAGCADTPAVAGFEAGESVLRHWGAEVVAEGFGGFEEGRVDDTADGVDAVVIGASFAAAGAVEAGHGLAAADVEWLAEDVFATVFDGFYGGHETPVPSSSIPLFDE